MSRAFVNEDDFVQDSPDRPVSTHPNYVTFQGLAFIETELDAAKKSLGYAQAAGDRDALSKAARDVRYWSARRATAQVVVDTPAVNTVQFGSTVSLIRDGSRKQTFKIVGEDEADPAKGTISHVSPLAVSLLGKSIGDVVEVGASEVEIIAIQ